MSIFGSGPLSSGLLARLSDLSATSDERGVVHETISIVSLRWTGLSIVIIVTRVINTVRGGQRC